jgi:hypothetical protein
VRRHGGSPRSRRSLCFEQVHQRLDRGVDRLELLRVELAQPCGEPGRPLRLDGAKDLVTRNGEGEADAALVALDRRALHEPGFLQARDELRHARNGHPLERRELAHPDSRPVLDLDEEADLASGHAERVDLTPQLAVELEEHGAKPVRKGGGVDG